MTGRGDHGERTGKQGFLEGWPRKFSAEVSEMVKRPSTVLLFCSIVLQHMHKLALGYAGYKKVKCIFQLHVLHFSGDNVHFCFIQILSIVSIEEILVTKHTYTHAPTCTR